MKKTKKITAWIAALSILLSMSTVALAAETKTISVDGTNLFSITNVVNSYVDTYEDEGEVFHDEVMECEAPATITVLSKIYDVSIMDHTYEIQNNNDRDTGYIMPDGCPNEKEFWETSTYRENVAAGTTYTLTEPGTYGINLFFEDGTSYYACVEIAGQRTKDGANFTKAYYQESRENQVDNTEQVISEAVNDSYLNSNLISYKNILNSSGTVKVENQNTGEIIEGYVYSCLSPAEITAKTDLNKFVIYDMAKKTVSGQEVYYPNTPLVADDETEEEFRKRFENTTPAGTKYTVVSNYNMYYLHASKGDEYINVVLRVDGAAPINISNGKRAETVPLWKEIPNASVVINGVYDITYWEGEPVYVIDKDSTVTFNCYLNDYITVATEGDGDQKPLLESDVCSTVVYDTITYDDNKFVYDENSELVPTTQVKPGMTLKFNKIGKHWIFYGAGYASRDERLSIQNNENTDYAWQGWPTMMFWVIDPTPTAKFTASKVIVNGVETEFEAYNINDNNYFKLRDVAMAVNGTEKQFAVFWDGDKNAISMISNAPYTPVGGELAKGDGTSKSSVMTTSLIYKDEKPVSLSAYNINNNNYFKLRDLGEAFDFDVSWDGANNCIMIDTSSSYTAD